MPLLLYLFLGNTDLSPGQCGSVSWVSSHTPKGLRVESQSGHMPGLQVRSLVVVSAGGSRSMFLTVVFPFLFLSLPSSLSGINKRKKMTQYFTLYTFILSELGSEIFFFQKSYRKECIEGRLGNFGIGKAFVSKM